MSRRRTGTVPPLAVALTLAPPQTLPVEFRPTVLAVLKEVLLAPAPHSAIAVRNMVGAGLLLTIVAQAATLRPAPAAVRMPQLSRSRRMALAAPREVLLVLALHLATAAHSTVGAVLLQATVAPAATVRLVAVLEMKWSEAICRVMKLGMAESTKLVHG